MYYSCSKAAWELHIAFIKPLRNHLYISQKGFRKVTTEAPFAALKQLSIVAHADLEKQLHTTDPGL